MENTKSIWGTINGLTVGLLAAIVTAIIMAFSNIASAAPAQEKVEVIYFWGAECPHCKNLKPWLDETEEKYKDTLHVGRYEFWHNDVNAQFFLNTIETFRVPRNQAGAPAMVINNKMLIGTKEIKERFEAEYNDALKKIEAKNSTGEALLTGQVDLGSKVQEAKESKDIHAITVAALADSINPCAMAVLVILLSSLVVMQKSKSKVILTAVSFIAASYIAYFLVGLGLTQTIASTEMAGWIVKAVGAVALIVGLAELKDAFFYRKGGWSTEIPEAWRLKLSKLVLSVTGPAGAFTTGLAVTFFELPCTGGPYLFGLSLISQHTEAVRLLLLAYYNFIFVLPLVLIAAAVILGKESVERIRVAEELRNKHVKAMHFIIGVVMLAMGVWALFIR